MNGKDLLHSMTEINQEFITEAEFPEIRTPKKNRKMIQVVSALAAAAMMTATAGAVSEVFSHRETVENFLFGNSREQLEEWGLVSNYVTENDYFRMTTETILNDGYRLHMIVTVEPLNETAQEFIAERGSFPFGSHICYTDTGEQPEGVSGGGVIHREDGKVLASIEQLIIELDTTRPAQMQFTFFVDLADKNYMLEGLEVPLDSTPNLESVEFKSESGQTVILTPLILYSEEQSCLTDPNHRIYMIKNNGQRVEIDDDFELSGLSSRGCEDSLKASKLNPDVHRHSFLEFDKIIDIEDYKGVEFQNRNTSTTTIYKKGTE